MFFWLARDIAARMYYTGIEPFTKRTAPSIATKETAKSSETHQGKSIMSLHDHFNPPLKLRRSWTSFQTAWATYMTASLNGQLPEDCFAEPTARFGIEIDVAAGEEPGESPRQTSPRSEWTPPASQATPPLVLLTDVMEVRIVRYEGGPVLAVAIEFVRPSNKDRPLARDAFVSKCAAYLQQGTRLMIVDIVTERYANLHGDLLSRVSPGTHDSPTGNLYAASYRPVQSEEEATLDVWYEELHLGGKLPTLTLGLRGGLQLPIELNATYERTCQKLRIPTNGV